MKKTIKVSIIFVLICTVILSMIVHASATPTLTSSETVMTVGDSKSFEEYDKSSEYVWEITKGADIIKITSGAKSYKVTIKAVTEGSATLLRTQYKTYSFGKTYTYKREYPITVEPDLSSKAKGLTSINGVKPSDLAANTAKVWVDGTPGVFFLGKTSRTVGGGYTFTLFTILKKNGDINREIYFIIEDDLNVNEPADTALKHTQDKCLIIYYNNQLFDECYYSDYLSFTGNNIMMLTAKKSGKHYEGCFTGDVKSLDSSTSYKIEGVFNVDVDGEFPDVAKKYKEACQFYNEFFKDDYSYSGSNSSSGKDGSGKNSSGTKKSTDTGYTDCPICHGTGICSHCNGEKYVKANGHTVKCSACNGYGKCKTCGGTGRYWL